MKIVRALASSHRSLVLVAAHAMLLASVVGCSASPSNASTFGTAEEPVESVSPVLARPSAQTAERQNPIGTGEVASATFVNAIGGTLTMSDGTQLIVPSGALPSDLWTLTMTSSTAAASSEMVAVTPTYTFGPTSDVLAKTVRIYIPVTVPDGANIAELAVLWSHPGGEAGFEDLPTTFLAVDGDPHAFLAYAEVQRLGSCSIGYRSLPASDATISPR